MEDVLVRKDIHGQPLTILADWADIPGTIPEQRTNWADLTLAQQELIDEYCWLEKDLRLKMRVHERAVWLGQTIKAGHHLYWIKDYYRRLLRVDALLAYHNIQVKSKLDLSFVKSLSEE